MSFCLSTRLGNQSDQVFNQYLIMIKIIMKRIKNKTRKLTPSLIINCSTYVCVSGGENFFRFSHISKSRTL